MSGLVIAVAGSPAHTLSKPKAPSIRLLAGLGARVMRIWARR